MKKVLITLLLIGLFLTGCSKKDDGLTWDCVEYDTIEKMNEAAGTNIVSAAIAGKSDEWFGVISNSIAQYTFKVHDEEWCIRASKDVDNDISGLNYEAIGFEKDVDSTYYLDEVYMNRFFHDNTQYVISVNVKDKEVARSYFDNICGELKTSITGIKSGYEVSIDVVGDDVIYNTVLFNSDGTSTTMTTVYTFENDKMVKIVSSIAFETEQAAKDYLDDLAEYGNDISNLTLEGATISSVNTDVDFYSDYTKDEFVESMKNAMAQ